MTDLPTSGGSYIRDKSGKLVRQDDDAPVPADPAPPADPEPTTKGGK